MMLRAFIKREQVSITNDVGGGQVNIERKIEVSRNQSLQHFMCRFAIGGKVFISQPDDFNAICFS